MKKTLIAIVALVALIGFSFSAIPAIAGHNKHIQEMKESGLLKGSGTGKSTLGVQPDTQDQDKGSPGAGDKTVPKKGK